MRNLLHNALDLVLSIAFWFAVEYTAFHAGILFAILTQ